MISESTESTHSALCGENIVNQYCAKLDQPKYTGLRIKFYNIVYRGIRSLGKGVGDLG